MLACGRLCLQDVNIANVWKHLLQSYKCRTNRGDKWWGSKDVYYCTKSLLLISYHVITRFNAKLSSTWLVLNWSWAWQNRESKENGENRENWEYSEEKEYRDCRKHTEYREIGKLGNITSHLFILGISFYFFCCLHFWGCPNFWCFDVENFLFLRTHLWVSEFPQWASSVLPNYPWARWRQNHCSVE